MTIFNVLFRKANSHFEPSACVLGGEDKPECRKSEGSLNGQRVAWAACEKDCLAGLGLASEIMPRSQLEQMFPNVDGYAMASLFWSRVQIAYPSVVIAVGNLLRSVAHCKADDVSGFHNDHTLPTPATQD
jgi:hypothetical protein